MKWFRKNSMKLLVAYQCPRTSGNIVITVHNFKWTDETMAEIQKYISTKSCEGRPAIILNMIELKDEK